MRDKHLEEMKRSFRPEFINRLDGTVVFHALTREHIIQIVDLMLFQVGIQLKEQGIGLEVTTEAKELLAEKGFDPTFGARPLRRTIQNMIEDPLSEKILMGEYHDGDTVHLDREGEELVFKGAAAVAGSSAAS